MPGEGANNVDVLIHRTQICHSILLLALARNCIMIKAPPYSGKTCTLRLLQKSAMCEVEQFGEVYSFNAATVTETNPFEKAWERRFGTSWLEAWSPASPPKGQEEGAMGQKQRKIPLVLVDETQVLYDQQGTRSGAFWGVVKAMAAGSVNRMGLLPDVTAPRVVIIMAAAYGSQQNVPGAGYFPTPVRFPDSACVLMR